MPLQLVQEERPEKIGKCIPQSHLEACIAKFAHVRAGSAPLDRDCPLSRAAHRSEGREA